MRSGGHCDDVDPAADLILRQIHPQPFDPDEINPDKLIVSYDRPSDTLIIHLFGRGHNTISFSVEDYLYVMVTPDTETIVGIHSEGFLAQAIKDIPDSVELLNDAELRGLTVAEVQALQRETLGVMSEAWWSANAGSERRETQRMTAVSTFITALRARWNLAFLPDMP